MHKPLKSLELLPGWVARSQGAAQEGSSKPALPPEAKGLHYLLSTPFRYPPPPHGSRFRSPIDPGVFYGADEIRTACAELGYWRWRFLMDCPALEALDAKPQTVFRAQISTTAVDLRKPPFADAAVLWTHPTNYTHCQQFDHGLQPLSVRFQFGQAAAFVCQENDQAPVGVPIYFCPHAVASVTPDLKPETIHAWTRGLDRTQLRQVSSIQ